MKIINRLFMLTIILGAVLSYAAVDSDPAERIFSMPVSETQEVIIPWLEHNGFQVFRASQDPLQVRLEAEKSGLHWVIRLKAYSPLATRVQVQTILGNTGPSLLTFWNYLDGYVKMPTGNPQIVQTAIPTIVRDHLNAVVCIYSERSGTPIQLSGFAISTKGLIVSTAHDLKLDYAVSVQFRNGREMSGRVVKLDAYRDLCLIQVPEVLDTVVSIRNGRYMPGRDDALFALGCIGAGLDGIQTGALDGPPRRVDGLPLWQVRMHVEHGSSGSPIFDDQGRLTAVVKGRFRGTNAVGFLIPFETLLHFLEKY